MSDDLLDAVLARPVSEHDVAVERACTAHPALAPVLRRRYAAMSGAERALMALQMFETAQRIVLSSLPSGLSDRERQRELCRRFYGEALARQAYP